MAHAYVYVSRIWEGDECSETVRLDTNLFRARIVPLACKVFACNSGKGKRSLLAFTGSRRGQYPVPRNYGATRNTKLLTNVAAGVITFTGPYNAPAGTDASTSPGETIVKVAGTPPLNVTSVAPDRSVP